MDNIFSLVRGNGRASGLDSLVSTLQGEMTRALASPNQEASRAITMAVESLASDQSAAAALGSEMGRLQDLIGSAISNAADVNLNVMGLEGLQDAAVGAHAARTLSDVQLNAASYIAAAFANPVGFAEAALRPHATPAGHTPLKVTCEGIAGTVSHSRPMGLESFSEQPLRQMMGWSIIMAATGAKQDDFCEAFFPYVLVGAGDMGLTLSLSRAMIVGTPNHDQSGNPNDLSRVNLIDAARNPSLLEDESTRLFPVLHQDPSHPSRRYIVAGAAGRDVTVEQNTFQTAPLAFGEVGLISICTPDYLVVPGVMELTDAIGQGTRIEYVTIKVGDDFINIRTRELNTFGFLPAPEGAEERQVINATTKSATLSPTTRNDRGQLPAALQLLRDNNLTVRFGLSVNGELNLQHSVCDVSGRIRGVYAVIDADGNDVDTTSGVGAQVLALMESAQAVGWYPFGVRTNENLRTLGKLFDTLEERFAYGIPLTSPFSVLAPVGSSQPAKNLETLIAAQRRRMNAAGVTTLLNHLSNVEAHEAARRAGLDVSEIGSVGARLTKPYFRRLFIDATTIQSLRENDRALDLAAKITNLIRFHAAEMAVETGYTAALEASTRGSKELRLLVGTSIRLHQQLMVTGDLRTFGPMFNNPKVVSTLNEKMDGKIVVTFTRDSEPGVPDELGFGWCAGLPELVTVVDTRRGGSMRKEATTQGRYLHIPNLPFGFIIEVEKLEEALRDESAYRVEEVGQADGTDPDPFPGSGSGSGNGSGTDTGGGTVTP